MSDHSNPTSRDHDDLETLAALDAIEGRGIRVQRGADRIADDLVEEFEAAAGALFAAWPRSESAPAPSPGFQDRLERFVLSQVSAHETDSYSDFAEPRAAGPAAGPAATRARVSWNQGSSKQDRNSGRAGLLAVTGWLVAAGLLAFVLTGGFGQSGRGGGQGETDVRQQFDQFVAAGHTVEPWQSLDENSTVTGGVAWDDELNEGFMQIAGLAANDPSVEQYQLWIFRTDDPGTEPHPVDGGVFDVTSSGEVIVPIDAKLNVGHAGIFAVTVEKPGGVVVSDRSGLMILAKSAS